MFASLMEWAWDETRDTLGAGVRFDNCGVTLIHEKSLEGYDEQD